MTLDTFMDDFGRDLTRAATARSRRRKRYLRLTPVIPVAAALALALTLLPTGGGGVDAIAAARAALAPDGEVVHMKVKMGVGRARASEIEQWYAADPVRWRTRQVVRGMGRVEFAQSNDRLRFYDAKRDVVTIHQGVKFLLGPNMIGTDLREQLAKGDVRDDGVVTVDGRKVRRLVRDTGNGRWTQRFVYYMDPQTFAPIAGHTTILRKGAKPLRGPEFVVTAYERLPLNAQTERLLKLDKTPDTKYVWLPRSDARPRRGR